MADGAQRGASEQGLLPEPGHPDEYVLDAVRPESRPTDPKVHALHLLPPSVEHEACRPRRSSAVVVDGDEMVFYWCRACDRCLPHWRSAFCQTHRDAYKRMRRRRRIRSSTHRDDEYVRVPRAVLEDLYEFVYQHLEARHAARQTGEPADSQRATVLSRRAFDIVLMRLPDYL